MDFDYTEEQMMFRNTARDFAKRSVAPVAKQIIEENDIPKSMVKEMQELGFLGILAPEEYGGMNAGNVAYSIVVEELAKVSLGVTMAASQNSLALMPILNWGTQAQKDKYLRRLLQGEMFGSIAVTEPNHGSDPSSMETMAVPEGNGWLVNGTKMFITQLGQAGMFITAAQTDKAKKHKGIVAFIVDRGMPGFSDKDYHGKLGLRGTRLTELVFEDLRIPPENVLGKVGDGFKVLMTTLDSARILASSACVGISQGAIEASVAYAKQRKQFGKLIGSFQLVQAMIADMIMMNEASRLLVHKAAYLIDKGQRGLINTSYAKLFATEAAQKITYNAVQIHGGYGYIDEYPVERYFRDARAYTIIEGTSQIHQLNIGRDALGIDAMV